MMWNWVKTYWWLLLLLPVVGYFLYQYYLAKEKVNASTANARAGKAARAAEELNGQSHVSTSQVDS